MSYIPPPAPQPYLPGVSWKTSAPDSPVATRSDINSVASSASESQAQVAAENAPLRVVYGRARIGAQVADALTWQNDLILVLIWCEGEINAVESITIGDEAVPAGITLTHYNGTAGQTANATLVSAYASHGIAYSDALPGIAYTVARVPSGKTNGFPVFNAIIQGRKLYDPRTGLTAWSDNPALALADFIGSGLYGMGKTVDSDSLIAAANFCDEPCGTEKRRLIGLALDSTQPCAQWLEALRTYAGCFVSPEGSSYRLIPDKAATTSRTFNASQIVANSLKLKKKGIQQIPTVVDVRYTDTSVLPWAEKSAIAQAAGVDAGTTPRRESRISLPGITRYSQAYREAVERLNKLSVSDLSADFTAFDEALAVQVGDIVEITHPIGLSAKAMRVMSAKILDAGRWAISALEYDPAAYSDAVAAAPTYGDTTLPNPASPPAITGISAVEEVYQQQDGTYSSRIKATWDAVTYPYLASYRIEIYQSGQLMDTASPRDAVYRTASIQEGLEYVVLVAAITSIGSVGAWSQDNIIALGKDLIPGNVPSVAAFEAGGRVYVSWTPAVDIDIWRYEVRYGAAGATWADAILIDRVDALRLTSDQIPVGTWTLQVKAIDSVQQYSQVAATCTVTVTSDAASFLVASYAQTAPTLSNMAEYSISPADTNRYAVSEDGVIAATKFIDLASTYTNVAATYHASMTSTWLGEAEDFGLMLGGQWTGEATLSDISGAHISYMGFSTDAAAWTYLSGLSQKTNARFARLKHEALAAATMKATIPTQNIRIDAIPREEVGSGTSSASGPMTITLANEYVAVKKLTITPQGATARSATYDNIVVGPVTSFDVYVFDQSGAKMASPFVYDFQGV